MNNNIPINWTIPTSYKAMHETKSPHMNHIHQHKNHNTIDLDLQGLYSISIKGITMIVCSKLFFQSSKLANKRRGSLIYTQEGRMASSRRAHQVFTTKLPSVGWGLPPLPHSNHVSNNCWIKERAPLQWLVGCHLKRAPPLQEGRTSLTQEAQILWDMQSIKSLLAWYCPLWPFDWLCI